MHYYWDTCGSPVIKRLCFFVVFFFSSATKWKNCAIVPSGHWALNTMTTNCDPMRVKVFTCWLRMLSWWWLTLSCTDRAASHDEPRKFCLQNSFVSHFVFVLELLLWRRRCNIFVYDYLELYGASRIVRGQSTLKDVIERYFWNGLSRERLKPMKALYASKAMKTLYALYASMQMSYLKNVHLLHWKKQNRKSETKLRILYAIYWTTLLPWDWRTKL